MIFDRSIPTFAQENLAAAVFEICRKYGIDPDSIGRYVCHPGGMKVIEALESAMNLKAGSLDHERDVLANYGNMSAPTALFVLERVLREGIPERAMMMALGPGFTLSTALLGRIA